MGRPYRRLRRLATEVRRRGVGRAPTVAIERQRAVRRSRGAWRPSGSLLLLLGRLIGVSASLAGVGLLLTSAWLIVRAAEQPPVMYLMVAIVGVRFFGFARTGLRYVERLVTHDVALRRVVALRVRVHRALARRAGHFATLGRRGDVVQRVVADVDAAQDRPLRIHGPWVVTCVTVAVVAAVVGVIEPAAGLTVLIGSATALGLLRRAGRSRPAGSDEYSRTRLHGELAAEVGSGPLMSTAAAHRLITCIERSERRDAARSGRGSMLVLVTTAVVVATMTAWVGQVDPVLAGLLVLAPIALIEPLESVADAERLRPEVSAAERRLAELLERPAAVVEPTRPLPVPRGHDIVLEEVVVGWDEPVAAPVSAVVPSGTAVVVTGASGAGKSTLALTLTRHVEPLGGSIRLGGVDLTQLTGDDVRSVVGLLGQDEMVFDTTLRENLRIGAPDATDGELRQVLRRVGLAHWLTGLRDGLDTEVGPHGDRLSGGERQRLALARVLLGGRRVVIVDEPTEHLDEPAGDALMDDLLALCPDVTVIVVSHDPRVLARFESAIHLG